MPCKVLSLRSTEKLQLCRKDGLVGVVGLFLRREDVYMATTFYVTYSDLISNHGVLISFLDVLYLWQLVYRFVVASRRVRLKGMFVLTHRRRDFQMGNRWESVLYYSIILWLRRSIDRGLRINLYIRANTRFNYWVLPRRLARLLETFCISRHLQLLFYWENSFLATIYFNLIFDFSDVSRFLKWFRVLGLLLKIVLAEGKMMLIFLLLFDVGVVICAKSK